MESLPFSLCVRHGLQSCNCSVPEIAVHSWHPCRSHQRWKKKPARLTNAVSFRKGNYIRMRKLVGKTVIKDAVGELAFLGRMGLYGFLGRMGLYLILESLSQLISPIHSQGGDEGNSTARQRVVLATTWHSLKTSVKWRKLTGSWTLIGYLYNTRLVEKICGTIMSFYKYC